MPQRNWNDYDEPLEREEEDETLRKSQQTGESLAIPSPTGPSRAGGFTTQEQWVKDSAFAPSASAPAASPAAPASGYNYEGLRDYLYGQGKALNSTEKLQELLAARPDLSGGVSQVGADKIRLPNGEMIDVIGGLKTGQGQAAWGGVGGGGDSGGGAGGGGGTPAPIPGQMNYAKPMSDPMSDVRQKLIDQLLQRSGQSLAIDSKTDPTIRSQADPYAAAQTRASRENLADLAERSGPLANLQGEARLASERTGQASGLFESQLVGREIEARRQEIQSALSGVQGLLTAEQQMALQRELGYLDDATRRMGISTAASTAASGQNLGWQQALLQNEQFLNSLGLQAENQYNYWDAVRGGLIGG